MLVILGLAAALVAIELWGVLRPAPAGLATDAPVRAAQLQVFATRPEAGVAGDGAAGRREPPAVVLTHAARIPWSSGHDGLGRRAEAEGNPEGPAAVAADGAGGVLIVDGVNGRLVLRGPDGDARVLASPLAATTDVAALPGGGFALLDRLVDRAVAVVDPVGNLRAKLPLPGAAGESGLLTGVFASQAGVCVEREHGACVPVATTSGEPAAASGELPGRPAADGTSILHAGIVAAPSVRVHIARNEGFPPHHVFSREVLFQGSVRSIDFLDATRAGELFLGVTLDSRPEEHLVLCLAAATGDERARVTIPASPLPDEVTRAFAALPEGGFVYLFRTAGGAELRRYTCVQ